MQIIQDGDCFHFQIKSLGLHQDQADINKLKKNRIMQQYIISSLVYSGLGIFILLLAFVLIELLTPKHNLRKEIMENKNIAVAIFAGFFMIAIAIIIASAIHG